PMSSMRADLAATVGSNTDGGAQADVEHDRRGDPTIRMMVGLVEEARQVEGATDPVSCRGLIFMLSAHHFLGPQELSARHQQFLHRRADEPYRNGKCDDRIERSPTTEGDQSPGYDRSERDTDVAEVVQVGQANRRVFSRWLAKEDRYPPIRRCCGESRDNRYHPMNGRRMRQ